MTDLYRSITAQLGEIKSIDEYAFEALVEEVDGFQRGLSADREVGISVNGTENIIHVRTIRHSGHMVVFEGTDTQGRDARLIQHYSQVHVQMTAVDKIGDEAKRIGFHRPE